ncbi:heme-binding protein [Geodermatophilus ruber]|nr:heme-binding protein [Geodermatophilus ruber]
MAEDIGHEQARDAVAVALAHAAATGLRVSVAVVDAGGWDVAVGRGDGAPGFTAGIARAKAGTAAAFRRPSGELAALREVRPEVLELAGEQLAFRPTTLSGGVPVVRDGAVVGAVGVAGATPEQDVECAEAACAVLARP